MSNPIRKNVTKSELQRETMETGVDLFDIGSLGVNVAEAAITRNPLSIAGAAASALNIIRKVLF